jgi:hypothetical protein
MTDLKQIVQLQMAEIDKLRAENRRLLGWITGDEPDALLAVQRVYSDPKANENNVIKAAASALPFERSKPASVSVVIDFKEKVRNIRLRTLELQKAEWARQDAEKQPLDFDAPPAETILGGPEADPAAWSGSG